MEIKRPYTYTDDIQGYQSAVWDFLLEHSEITPSGNIFIKFHTDGRRNFENRIFGRWKYNYHREDVQAKAQKIEVQKVEHKLSKKEKREKYQAEKRARRLALRQSKEPKPVTINPKNVFKIFSKLKKLIKGNGIEVAIDLTEDKK